MLLFYIFINTFKLFGIFLIYVSYVSSIYNSTKLFIPMITDFFCSCNYGYSILKSITLRLECRINVYNVLGINK